MSKERLDILVTKRGIATSRERAKALIMEGKIFVDGVREDKPGTSFPDDIPIELHGETLKYVSRGGLKLEKAIQVFGIDLTERICMDIGASTGGFTDCMLINGAKKVYAIDSGRGQLAWKLRSDSRVVCMEKTNFRYLKRDGLDSPDDNITFASVDVSFISLDKILPVACGIFEDGDCTDYEIVCLIKPQFEAGRDEVGKKGVVRDARVHERVINHIISVSTDSGLYAAGLDYSPIKGPEGNIEYLIHLIPRKCGEDTNEGIDEAKVGAVVNAAHEELA